MTLTVFLVVLSAALLHALWNAMVKGGNDKAVSMAAVILGHGIFALCVLPFAAWPAIESWPYILASIALHQAYQLLLMASYKIGDLTQVYPIARGTAPLLVTAISTAFLGIHLARIELFAVAMIAVGIMSLSLVRQRDGLRNHRAAGLALLTGCFIAAYSLVDGIGARASGTPLGFYATMTLGNTFLYCALARALRPGLLTKAARAWPVVIGGGGASSIAYALVVWAFTQAPIALVTALRETSIVFALLIGVFFFRERLDLSKVISTFLTIGGAILLRFAR